MFSLLCNYFKGVLTIEARGFACERFINLAVHKGIKLWDVKRGSGYVLFKTEVKHFRTLLKFAKKTGVKVKLKKRQGCPFFVYKYRKRYLFSIGIAAFFIFLFVMSSFVWLIEIEGNNKLSKYEIVSVLNDNGLSVGSVKYFINTTQIEQNLKKNFDDISWIHIKLNGTKATVEIVEKIANQSPATLSAPCDIISESDALVTDIIASSGKPVVKVDDVVKKGSVLISADITYMQDGTEVVYGQVASAGIVKGKVQRTFTYSSPYIINTKKPTGNKAEFFNIKIFNAIFSTNFIKNDVSFKKYDIIREIKQLQLGEKFPLPVFVERFSYNEYNIEQLRLSPAEAKKICQAQLNKQIMEFYSTQNDILAKEYSFKEDKNRITATATVMAVENIGKVSYIVPDTTERGNAVNGTSENPN